MHRSPFQTHACVRRPECGPFHPTARMVQIAGMNVILFTSTHYYTAHRRRKCLPDFPVNFGAAGDDTRALQAGVYRRIAARPAIVRGAFTVFVTAPIVRAVTNVLAAATATSVTATSVTATSATATSVTATSATATVLAADAVTTSITTYAGWPGGGASCQARSAARCTRSLAAVFARLCSSRLDGLRGFLRLRGALFADLRFRLEPLKLLSVCMSISGVCKPVTCVCLWGMSSFSTARVNNLKI